MGKEMRYYYNAEHGVQFVRYASRTLSTHNSFVVVNGGAVAALAATEEAICFSRSKSRISI